MNRIISSVYVILLLTGVCFHSWGAEKEHVVRESISIRNISQVCADEIYKNERLKTEYSKLILRYRKACRIVSADVRLQAFLELKQVSRKLLQELTEAQESQVQLLMMVDQIGKGRELLPQEVPYVLNNRSKISRLGKNQQSMIAFIGRMNAKINQNIRQMPLPARYVNKFGIPMKLVAIPRKKAFYISMHPLCQKELPTGCGGRFQQHEAAFATGLDYRQAWEICRKMQIEDEGMEYRLPTCDELKLAAKAGLTVPVAVWSRSLWSEDWKEEENCKRFGISMFTVWDPSGVLKKGRASVFFPELPDAFYRQLGMVVVAPEKSGMFSRFHNIQKKIESISGQKGFNGKENR